MGYRFVIEPGVDSWTMILGLTLSRAESSDLFLSGDSLLSWPTDGLRPSDEGTDPRLERSSLFVSEVVTRAGGLELRYSTREQAERAEALLHRQLVAIGLQASEPQQDELHGPRDGKGS